MVNALGDLTVTVMIETKGRLYTAASTTDNQPVLLNNKCIYNVTNGAQTVVIGQIGQMLPRKNPSHLQFLYMLSVSSFCKKYNFEENSHLEGLYKIQLSLCNSLSQSYVGLVT